MTPSQHAAAVVATDQARELAADLDFETFITVKPYVDQKDLILNQLCPTAFEWYVGSISGVLAILQTTGPKPLQVLAVFVPEEGPK